MQSVEQATALLSEIIVYSKMQDGETLDKSRIQCLLVESKATLTS